MHLHRRLRVTQKTAWFMTHRIREALSSPGSLLTRPIEINETYIGRKEGNKHAKKKLHAGRGTVGKTPVVGAKDRETKQVKTQVVESVNRARYTRIVAWATFLLLLPTCSTLVEYSRMPVAVSW